MNDRVTAIENKLKELEDRIQALEPKTELKKVVVPPPAVKGKRAGSA